MWTVPACDSCAAFPPLCRLGLSLSALEFMFWQKCAWIGNKHKAITLSRCWQSSQKHRAPNMCRWPGSWNNRSGEFSYIVNWRSVHFTIVLVITTRLMGKKILRGNNYCGTPLLVNYKTKASISPTLFYSEHRWTFFIRPTRWHTSPLKQRVVNQLTKNFPVPTESKRSA